MRPSSAYFGMPSEPTVSQTATDLIGTSGMRDFALRPAATHASMPRRKRLAGWENMPAEMLARFALHHAAAPSAYARSLSSGS